MGEANHIAMRLALTCLKVSEEADMSSGAGARYAFREDRRRFRRDKSPPEAFHFDQFALGQQVKAGPDFSPNLRNTIAAGQKPVKAD